MKKKLILAFVVFDTLLFGIGLYAYFTLKDRHPGYWVNMAVGADGQRSFSAGFAAVSITPELPDTWTDANGDAQYHPEDGDTFQDGNGNGQFDAYWIAGFSQFRAANGVHDPLWARAMVLDDGQTRLAIVAIDAIGFFADDVISVRKRVAETANVDYVIITSSHTHESPDLLGLWGESYFSTGVNQAYRQMVIERAAEAVGQAASHLRPAYAKVAQADSVGLDMLNDTRPPRVFDPGLRVMQLVDAQADTTLGTLVGWANHPETLWSKNLLLTSDFPHYVREGVENGILQGDSVYRKGLGGTALYLNGAIGGLMTTDLKTTVTHPITGQQYLDASYEKAEAQGLSLAWQTLNLLDSAERIDQAGINLVAKSVEIPLDNSLFRLAAFLGVVDRGMVGFFKIRTEVAAWTFGPVSFLHLPGEVYPEILNGGIEAPNGQDFALQPQEIPPLRGEMPGKYRWMVGLSNDMLGYIIPQSQWDTEAPFAYEREEAPYGEINSVGPETAPRLHKATLELIEALKQL